MIPRLFGVTTGDGRAAIRAALDAGLPAVVVRETAIPEDLPLDPRIFLHARMPGASMLATERGYGLHLSATMDVAGFRQRVAGLLGVSTHSVEEARAAFAQGADYVFLSPVWSPGSKPGDMRPTLGIAGLAAAIREIPGPVIALGGVTPERVRACREAGAHGVAAMGGIFAGDVAANVRAYLDPP